MKPTKQERTSESFAYSLID